MTSIPDNMWGFLAVVVLCLLQAYTIWQNSKQFADQQNIKHQLNSLTDARVLSAGQAGRAEGMILGAAGEREHVAKIIAAQVAVEVAKKLAEDHMPAIKVKEVTESQP